MMLNTTKIVQLRQEIEQEKQMLRELVGTNLKRFRTGQSITQADLAIAAGIERTSITNIETGKNNMTIEQLMSFCEVFQTTPNQLLGVD